MRGEARKRLPRYFVMDAEAELPSNHPLQVIKRRPMRSLVRWAGISRRLAVGSGARASPQSWASLKSLKPKNASEPKRMDGDPGNPTVDFHGEKRSKATHRSATHPEAWLMRKGKVKEAYLCHSRQVLMKKSCK